MLYFQECIWFKETSHQVKLSLGNMELWFFGCRFCHKISLIRCESQLYAHVNGAWKRKKIFFDIWVGMFVILSVRPSVSMFVNLYLECGKVIFYLGIRVDIELSGQNNWKNDVKEFFSVKAKASAPVLFFAVHVWASPVPSDSKQVATSFVKTSFGSKYWFSKVLQKKVIKY